MASSEKPDFIDSKEKEAPIRLTAGGVSSGVLSDEQNEKPLAEGPVSLPSVSPSGQSQSPPSSDAMSKQHLKSEKEKLPGKKFRRLPGGSLVFISLLATVCFFGNQIDEFRNRTLADLAGHIYGSGRGFIETVGDLGQSLMLHGNPDGAKAVYEKALAGLVSKGRDSGEKAAYLRLKIAQVDFYRANAMSREAYYLRGKARQQAYDKAWQHEAQAKATASKALDSLAERPSRANTELPFLLSSVAQDFESWSDYEMAKKVREKALSLWPRGWRNGRAYEAGTLAFDYLLTGNPARAEEHLKSSLTWTMRKGAVTSQNAWNLSILGRSQVDLKKYMDAQMNLSHSLEMWDELRSSEGNLDIEYARIYTDQGRIKTALGDNSAALKLFEKAEEILKKNPDRTYDTLRNHYMKANLYRDMGEYSKARDLYSRVIAKLDSGDYGPDRKAVMKDWDLLRRMSGGR